jgi:hypothetical protein
MTGASNRVWTSGLWSREPSMVARLLRQQGKSLSRWCGTFRPRSNQWYQGHRLHQRDLFRLWKHNNEYGVAYKWTFTQWRFRQVRSLPVKTLLPLEARSTYYALFWCVYVSSHLLIVIACVLSAPYPILYTRTGYNYKGILSRIQTTHISGLGFTIVLYSKLYSFHPLVPT